MSRRVIVVHHRPRVEYIRRCFEARLSSIVSQMLPCVTQRKAKGLVSISRELCERAMFTTVAASKLLVAPVLLNP